MPRARIWLLTLIALIAFAGNSLLCRLALKETHIDPASFTAVRLVSGAIVLWWVVRLRATQASGAGNWGSAYALLIYAICFSFAYVSLSAGTGALLLFGAVQATMIGGGLIRGERLHAFQTAGYVVALAGLIVLMLPGVASPSLYDSVLMLVAGVSWGVYSLRGRGGGDPTRTTAGNFLRAAPLAIVSCLVAMPDAVWNIHGVVYAVASGAIASGLGYAIWYTALKGLRATEASATQLAVPVIAALGGVVLLGEPVLATTAMSSAAILGGIAMVLFYKPGQ